MSSTTPAPKPRKFGGTPKQIRAAATFYKVFAYITGVMLLLLVLEMIFKYFWSLELFVGGTLVDGTSNAVGMYNRAEVAGGLNLSLGILIAHGWLYVVYLFADFRLWTLMRWPFMRFITIALGGVVPFLSFWTEAKVHAEVDRELAAHPKAAKRY
ncbi:MULTISPECIES: DUF3817 domain-containing protein [Micrococcaceae]|uniref:DUF3817 domain-containing protein n=1 Tax=Micrococcaceae TaxID=1268 RepID=UPI000CFC086E|nr:MULTISPECIES: DUF3817 domain-containing protein [unclassified Arthrobacter]MCS3491247.1 hypothetical protein [Arthrobacter sp. JUb119]PQZ87483.1 hypothetical protein CQ016_08150 [Arthrobacter sp. MYb222]PRB78742.1 hypothetical protein CQ012_05160 [Arthrobacter sp. MYb214]TDU27854.1 integral membrane protein [Arthrobacter sp. JUb115]